MRFVGEKALKPLEKRKEEQARRARGGEAGNVRRKQGGRQRKKST